MSAPLSLLLDPRTVVLPLLSAATHLLSAARAEGIVVRLCGGLACWLHSHDARAVATAAGRDYSDIDLAARFHDRPAVLRLLAANGYREDPASATVPGLHRTIFADSAGLLHGDVFYDTLEFCHTIDFRHRLVADTHTLPVADLLLQKLQILRFATKDVVDTHMLLLTHAFDTTDDDCINTTRIADLCGDDWGLYWTMSTNLRRLTECTRDCNYLTAFQQQHIAAQLQQLQHVLASAPKSISWHLRSLLGSHMRWYETVDEH